VIDAAGLPVAADAVGWDLPAAVEGRVSPALVERLSDRVLEPEDHEHD
jgi:hypothetical protein